MVSNKAYTHIPFGHKMCYLCWGRGKVFIGKMVTCSVCVGQGFIPNEKAEKYRG